MEEPRKGWRSRERIAVRLITVILFHNKWTVGKTEETDNVGAHERRVVHPGCENR